MSEISLFNMRPEVAPIELRSAELEKDIQSLVENNMETFFGVRFIKTEHSIRHANGTDMQEGRIDSLGLDENNCPVIFEYKRDSDQNVINQGLFYLDWLINHQGDFAMLVGETLGKEAESAIDWTSPSVYCIASSFGKYDEYAVKQMDRNIKLVRYAVGGDIVLFEFLNSPSTTSGRQDARRANSGDKTYREQYDGTTQALRDVVDEVREFMASLGNDLSENELKLYLAIRKSKNIVCVEVNQTKVTLHLKLDPDTVEANELVSDARAKGHWGTGDVEVCLKTLEELETVKPLLARAYHEN